MHKRRIAVLFAAVLFCTLVLAACSSEEEAAAYAATASLVQQTDGICTADVSLAEGENVTFADAERLAEAEYRLSVCPSGGDEDEFVISNVAVTRVNDKTVQIRFKTPLQGDAGAIYTLSAERGVNFGRRRDQRIYDRRRTEF